MAVPYVVVWTRDETEDYPEHDNYRAFADFTSAENFYNELCANPDVPLAHIMLPFRSTDYETITVWA